MAEGEGNIYTSGGVSMERFAEMEPVIKRQFAKERVFLDEMAKPEEAELMSRLETTVKLHIGDLHEKAGIKIKQMPAIFVIPEENWDNVCKKFDRSIWTDGFVGNEGTVVIVKEDDDLLKTAHAMYHEMMHAVGKVAGVINPDSMRQRQQGYWTIGKSQMRGYALEEGVAEFFAREFVINSDFEELRNARKKLTDEGSQRDVIEDLFGYTSSPEYNQSLIMVSKLIEVGGKELQSLLLASRTDGSKRLQLVKNLNMAFGDKNTARIVFKTKFDTNSIRSTNAWLDAR